MRNLSGRTRNFVALSLTAALGLSLSACGDGNDSASEGDQVSLRFSWWGSDPRHEANQQIIENFEAANPDINIEGEFNDFGGYWDRLATATAGSDAPDVITMDESYLVEYAGRGALADLRSFPSLDLSNFSDSALASGTYEDGLYGLSTGQNAFVVMINEDLFEKAGVAIPDDTTWTWAEYYALSAKLDEALEVEAGTEYTGTANGLRIWLRQQGESLFDPNGEGVGYSGENLASWFQHLLDVRDQGGGVTPATFTEDMSVSFEARSFPSGGAAIGWYWTNQLSALESSTGANIRMLRVPSENGQAADNGMYYKASMYWSISSQSEHQEAAARFVDYLANDPEAAEVMLVDRGVPANPEMVEAITPDLDESDQDVVNFLNEIEPDMAAAPAPSPVGGGSVSDTITRYASEVLFGNLTPQEAAEQMTAEVKNAIDAP